MTGKIFSRVASVVAVLACITINGRSLSIGHQSVRIDGEFDDFDGLDVSTLHERVKRDATGELLFTYNVTQYDRDELVRLHNGFRRAAGSSNMRLMSWDEKLAIFASNYISGCVFDHSPAADRTNFDYSNPAYDYWYVGENLGLLATASPHYDYVFLNQSVIDWNNNEINDFDYDTGACSNICGHYTQVVWWESYKVGCGMAICTAPSPFNHYVMTACAYGPGGNLQGEPQPFSKGEACSACGGDFCSDCLCANEVRGDVRQNDTITCTAEETTVAQTTVAESHTTEAQTQPTEQATAEQTTVANLHTTVAQSHTTAAQTKPTEQATAGQTTVASLHTTVGQTQSAEQTSSGQNQNTEETMTTGQMQPTDEPTAGPPTSSMVTEFVSTTTASTTGSHATQARAPMYAIPVIAFLSICKLVSALS